MSTKHADEFIDYRNFNKGATSVRVRKVLHESINKCVEYSIAPVLISGHFDRRSCFMFQVVFLLYKSHLVNQD